MYVRMYVCMSVILVCLYVVCMSINIKDIKYTNNCCPHTVASVTRTRRHGLHA